MERIVRISWLVVVWVDLVGHGTDWFGLVGTGSDWFGLAGRAWTLPSPLSLFLSLSLSLSLARSLAIFKNGLFMRSSSDVHRTFVFTLLETVVGLFFVYYEFDF